MYVCVQAQAQLCNQRFLYTDRFSYMHMFVRVCVCCKKVAEIYCGKYAFIILPLPGQRM